MAKDRRNDRQAPVFGKPDNSKKEAQTGTAASGHKISAPDPFSPGAIVVVTLGNPRDKFWGMVLNLAAEGLSISGIELASFEDLVVMVKDGESFTPAVVFFPMHRIERIELDLPDGNLPSLSERFVTKTGLEPERVLRSSLASIEPRRQDSIRAAGGRKAQA